MQALTTDQVHPAEHWDQLSAEHMATGQPALGILAKARAVGSGTEPVALADMLRNHAPELDEDAQRDKTREVAAIAEKMKRMDAEPDKVVEVLLRGILDGGDPSYLLRGCAQTLDQVGQSHVALELIRAAMAIAPPDRDWYADTLALILLNLARFDEAREHIETLAKADESQAAWLSTYATALTQPFDFWLAKLIDRPKADDAEPSPRPQEQAIEALAQIAGRIAPLVETLSAKPGPQDWLPDVSHLVTGVAGDPAPPIDPGKGFADLVWMLRVEWTRLCWAMVCLGADGIRQPAKIEAPVEPLDFFDTLLSVRFNLLYDLQGGGTPEPQDELDEWALASKWGETPMAELPAHLASIWLEETSAALAAVRWAAGKQESVFEDP